MNYDDDEVMEDEERGFSLSEDEEETGDKEVGVEENDFGLDEEDPDKDR